MVLRAEDGKLLGNRKVPNVNYDYQRSFDQRCINDGGNGDESSQPLGDVCLAKLGRKLLTWRRAYAENQNKARLDLFDPWTQQTVWPTRRFAADARVSLVGKEAVGVMEPDGHFVLVELPSGRAIADLKLEAETAWPTSW